MIIQLANTITKDEKEVLVNTLTNFKIEAKYISTQFKNYIVGIPKIEFDIRHIGNLSGIEDIHRVSAAYNLEKDIYLTTPFDTMNGMKPQYCTRYDDNTVNNNAIIDPQSKIIGPLGNFVESIVTELYNNVNNT